MKVKVLFFAQFREVIGASERTFDISADSNAGELLNRIVAENPALESIAHRSVIAVNRTTVPRDTRLRGGDEVAFLPPMTGG